MTFMINILIINLVLQALIFLYLLFQPNYFGILMNLMFLWHFLFVYHLIASAILIFIRLFIVKNGQNNFLTRAIIGIFSICVIIFSIVSMQNWSSFNYPFKISTILYLWAEHFPTCLPIASSIFLTILFSIVSWKEFKLELKQKARNL